jgi:nucleoside-triphosphatase THEP1
VTGPPESPRLLLAGPARVGQDAAIARLVELLRADGLAVNGFLYRVDDQHYVRDGHHRVSVARALGESTIDAEVVQLHPRR